MASLQKETQDKIKVEGELAKEKELSNQYMTERD